MSNECINNNKTQKGFNIRKLITTLVILICIPATILVFWKFGDRKYYLTSVVIIIFSMIPFFLSFEKRRPQAREIVVLSVMCAIAVASRAAFIMVPHFKPMTGIIIITGMAFGAEAGFLTGAMSALVSNFIFLQGPWTPWQMFAYGIAGFLAGYLYNKRILTRKKISLSIFGVLIIMLVVGPILDTCAIFTMSNMIDTSVISAVYLSGLPVNMVHASATMLTLVLVSGPMFEKLDRIKLKYGMVEYEI